jgi:uncharacterized protein
MAHPNEESLRRGYDAFGKGDIDTVMSLLTDDTLWHIPGRNPLSGDYRGKEAVGGFIMKLMELTSGTFQVEVHDVLANDEHGVGLVILRGERNGKTLAANDAQVWHVRDGLFSEFWSQIWDLYSSDEFWS